jgi:hypothetical protein
MDKRKLSLSRLTIAPSGIWRYHYGGYVKGIVAIEENIKIALRGRASIFGG